MWNKGSSIAIWGSGFRGRKLYYQIRYKYNVVCFIDQNHQGEKLDGIPIIHPEKIKDIDLRIIIAIEKYRDICMQCKKWGMKFYERYITYDMLNMTALNLVFIGELVGIENLEIICSKLIGKKKTALIIGNCQTAGIKKIMCSSPTFMEEYIVIDVPMIHLITESEKEILEKCKFVFNNLSLLITQIISENNSFFDFFCTENIRKIIGDNTKLVLIPTLYFDIYFPQTIHQSVVISELEEVGILTFPYGDCIINELSEKYTVKDIVEIIKSDNFFTAQFLKIFFDYRIETLKERENKCDIHILDYILENYKKKLLFYSKNHPNAEVLIELTKRLMLYLGYQDINCENMVLEGFDKWQELIYPSVSKALSLEFIKTNYLDDLFDKPCTFEEYVESYCSCMKDK
jgi:hypothetical protein